LAQAPRSLQEFYPPALLRRAVEGTVVVSLKIDTAGCPTAFAIAVSSGDEAFDEAALKWAETTSFLPGEKAGKAITSSTPLAVVFVLADS
jgi:TonB family protein